MFDHPSVSLGVMILLVLYAFSVWRIGERIRIRQAIAFACALLAIVIAHGPIDELADERLFFVHMFQHFLQTLVIPPLLLLGTPDWMLRPWLISRTVRPFARFFTKPLISFALFSGLLVMVHEPSVFDQMCRDKSFHIVIHILFMTTGTLLWWPLLSPMRELPRLSYPGQSIYLFLLLIPMSAVAAPLTLATTVIYPWYAPGPHPWELSPINDQVLGGLVMWVGESLYLMCVFSAIFFRWASRDDRDRPSIPGTILEVLPRATTPRV